jgi:hypothetical protein
MVDRDALADPFGYSDLRGAAAEQQADSTARPMVGVVRHQALPCRNQRQPQAFRLDHRSREDHGRQRLPRHPQGLR